MPVMQTASLQMVGDIGVVKLYTNTRGGGAGKGRICLIRYQQLICHASRLSTPSNAQTTEAA